MTDPYWSPDLGSTISASFTYDIGDHGWGNQELQMYTSSPSNAFITADGKSIVIRAVADMDDAGAERYTSARLVSKASLAQERGYLEASIRPPFASAFAWPPQTRSGADLSLSLPEQRASGLRFGFFPRNLSTGLVMARLISVKGGTARERTALAYTGATSISKMATNIGCSPCLWLARNTGTALPGSVPLSA